jgi:hypothetical protein
LLGVAIVDPSSFAIDLFYGRLREITFFVSKALIYFVFLVLLEWALRISLFVKRTFLPEHVLEEN